MGNSRPIRFRAWDKTQKRMIREKWYPIIPVNEDGTFGFIAGQDRDVIIMQYTGLKDKNGKEIYEGDVVDGMADRYFIKYGEGHYEFWESSTKKGYHWGIWNVHTELEVIGNIYENPELLK